MNNTTLTRRTVLRTAALATTALAMPAVRDVRAAPTVVPKGKMVLAWHTNIAARWLDPQQHDGTATPDNFLMTLHDALIKNFRETKYDHPALAESYDFAEDAKSCTFKLRPGTKFHDGTPVTPADVKWSFEHYRGAWAAVLQDKTQGAESSSAGSNTPSKFAAFSGPLKMPCASRSPSH
jgi:ABC-type transport system substrate-binding protein